MKHLLFTFLFGIIGCSLVAQSTSILIKDKANKPIAYANIDVYYKDSLKVSLISNPDGIAKAKLEDGLYLLSIKSFGHTDTSFKMMLISTSNNLVSLSKQSGSIATVESKNSSYPSTRITHSSPSRIAYSSSKLKKARRVRTMSTAKTMSIESESADFRHEDAPIKADYSYDAKDVKAIPSDKAGKAMSKEERFLKRYDLAKKEIAEESVKQREVSSGILTAGEVNDFSKWTLWQDESSQQLNRQQKYWDFAPQGRYTLMLKNQEGFPMVDVMVHLVSAKGFTVWTARTDNTGKAELWAEIDSTHWSSTKGMQIRIVKGEITQSIDIEYEQRFAYKVHEYQAPCNTSNQVDIAFVVDATGSMGDEINYLKKEMNDVMFKSKVAYPTLRFNYANIFYRDTRDAYLFRKQDFTTTLSESSAFVNAQYAGGGGDYEEAVEVGLEQAIDSLEWSKDARARILFVILDAPPHNTYDTRKKMKTLAKKAAKKGIRIIPIAASGINKNTELLMRSMALCTNGTYLFITDHSGVGNGHIKPTTDSYKVKSLNQVMVETIKNQIEVMDCQKQDDILKDSTLLNTDTFIKIDTVQVVQNDSLNHVDTTMSLALNWSYYPNPTSGIVYFKSSVSIPEVYIFDLRGTLVQIIKNTNPETKQKIDLRQFANGTYIIHFVYQKRKYSGKVILIQGMK